MTRLGLALVLLPCLAALGAAQEPSDFRPASSNVWDAQYPRRQQGTSRGPTEGARGHEGPAELLERAEIDMVKQPDGVWSAITSRSCRACTTTC